MLLNTDPRWLMRTGLPFWSAPNPCKKNGTQVVADVVAWYFRLTLCANSGRRLDVKGMRLPETANPLTTSLSFHFYEVIPVLAIPGPSQPQSVSDQRLLYVLPVFGVDIPQ